MAEPAPQPTFRGWMGSMWLYSILRFGLFFALWGLLYLLGLPALLAALLGLILSVPLSLVLLAGPRNRFTRQLELRLQAHAVDRRDLDAELQALGSDAPEVSDPAPALDPAPRPERSAPAEGDRE